MCKILYTGDIAIQGDCSDFIVSDEVSRVFSEYDVRICNFEGALLTEKARKRDKVGPSLIQNSSVLSLLAKLNINICGFANNHIMDYGLDNAVESMKILRQSGIDCMGFGEKVVEIFTPYIYEKEGKKIATIFVAENAFGASHDGSAGFAWFSSENVLTMIHDLKNQVDKIVLFIHAGAENLNYPIPEWKTIYHLFIDSGIDVIVAHHPHVVQGYESYHNGLIFYSLGNFLWQRIEGSVLNSNTYVVGLDFSDSEITYDIIPLRIENNSVTIHHDREYLKMIDRYCQMLSPEYEDDYMKIVNEYCCNLYSNSFRKYIFAGCGISGFDTFSSYIRSAFKSILRKSKINDHYVYHNACVETNSWIQLRAINTLHNPL